MFVTLCHVVSALGWVPSATFMFACAPQCFLVWLAWRVVSLPLPARVYERGDELFYTLYQSMIVFFFENVSGVEVMALAWREYSTYFIRRNFCQFVFHGDQLPEKGENVIYMTNHQCAGKTI
jgi:lysophosphatidate acyltransferase